MPYIEPIRRARIADGTEPPRTAGELNFAITRLCLSLIGPKPRYDDFNAVIGALECAKLELYRRAVAPYENAKIALNGDVYPVQED